MSSSSRRRPWRRDNRPAPSGPPGPPWLGPVLAVAGVCGLLLILPSVSRLAATWGWRAAPATVDTIQRRISPASFSGADRHWRLRLLSQQEQSITYSYSVNGRAYSGSDTVSELPRGRLTIYYDPDQPEQSVARRPGEGPVLATLALALALALYGVRGLRGRARRRGA